MLTAMMRRLTVLLVTRTKNRGWLAMKTGTAFLSLLFLAATLAGSACGSNGVGAPLDASSSEEGSFADQAPASDSRPDLDGGASPDRSSRDAAPPDVAPCILNRADTAAKLACVPGLTVLELHLPPDAGADPSLRYFLLKLDQPVDHENPSGPHFKQRLYLRHRDESAPMALTSGGYELMNYEADLSFFFETNVIEVEHRYFGPSIPSPVDWKFLNIKQSAADYHSITVALKAVYGGKWVGTGASKGGMTSVYHRRFWPADLVGTVAYVTPNSLGIDDARYPQFLATVGGD